MANFSARNGNVGRDVKDTWNGGRPTLPEAKDASVVVAGTGRDM